MHSRPIAAVRDLFWKTFSVFLKKDWWIDSAVRKFKCTDILPFKRHAIPHDKHPPSKYFLQDLAQSYH
jgi:hypothetical protein